MRVISRFIAPGVIAGTSAFMLLGVSATLRGNLIVDAGFEVPDASAADVNLPVSQAGAAANPTFPWYDLLANSGDQAEISSDIPAFSGASPATNRINSGGGATRTANSGDQYDYAFTTGRAAGTIGGAAQLVTGIVPGDLYVGSAYFMNKAATGTDGDRLQALGSNDSVHMIFEDSTAAQIGPVITSTIGGDLGLVDSNTPQNVWTQVSTLPTLAPVGASQVLFELALTRGASGGVQFGDDASLEDVSVVPEPASLGILTLAALDHAPACRCR